MVFVIAFGLEAVALTTSVMLKYVISLKGWKDVFKGFSVKIQHFRHLFDFSYSDMWKKLNLFYLVYTNIYSSQT